MSELVHVTKRATVQAIEDIMFDRIPVLDHGFVRVIDYMGDDTAVVQAARVSYGAGTKKTSQDQQLINYLMRHRHTTPFEMCDIKIHVKLPIFVARQWIRHRTASVNEYSARYSLISNEFYVPDKAQLAPQSSVNKQGRAEDRVSENVSTRVLEIIKEDAIKCHQDYLQMMNGFEQGEPGISRELSRINLTLNHYTEWYWKINLHNLLHFLALRADPHAQYEIRVYAETILDIVKKWVPFTYNAFTEYRLGCLILSKSAVEVVRGMIRGEAPDRSTTIIGTREWDDLMAALT